MPRKTPQAKRKYWSRSVGEYGTRVRVFEREHGGILYGETYDPTLRNGRGGYRKRSLGHRDKDRAVQWAKAQAGKLLLADHAARDATPTVGRVFAAYLQHHTPRNGTSQQRHDRRCAAMWTRTLGAQKDLRRLSLEEWQRFTDARSAGLIDAHGRRPPPKARRPVRTRPIEADLRWLLGVLNWATTWYDQRSGGYLMTENPARGFPVPREKNPRRPVADEERYRAVRSVADQVEVTVTWGGRREGRPGFLGPILDLSWGTGRRITPVLKLRWDDLRLDKGPCGAIAWPDQTDKMGKRWAAVISPAVRATLDHLAAVRPPIDSPYLFPSPRDPTKPLRKDVADRWLRRAEQLAGVPKQDGGLWHPYRRGWATARKHHPDVDVAAAGGWSDTRTLKTAYQQTDPETQYRVVTNPTRTGEEST